jgi:hypothetical protein
MVTAKKKGEEEVQIKSDPVLDNIASFIVEMFIKEDVNSFVEADLLQDLLVYKLDTVAGLVMEQLRGLLPASGYSAFLKFPSTKPCCCKLHLSYPYV